MNESRDHLDATTLLRTQRVETEQRLAALTEAFGEMVHASESSNADDEHDPEGATIAFERSQVGALIAQAREHLAELDDAELRVANGTYGICERCNQPIAPARLEARPVASRCVTCAALS